MWLLLSNPDAGLLSFAVLSAHSFSHCSAVANSTLLSRGAHFGSITDKHHAHLIDTGAPALLRISSPSPSAEQRPDAQIYKYCI